MNPYQRRRAIDAAVDARRKYQSWSFAAIKVRMTAPAMMEALGYPVPRGPHPCPSHCLYRGYRIEATLDP